MDFDFEQGWVGFVGRASTQAMSEASGESTSVVAYVTVPNRDVADTLAAGLVNSRLAACVNIIPGTCQFAERCLQQSTPMRS